MKKYTFYIFISLLFFGSKLYAQRFGNEWIVPTQTYAKLTINQNGIYRITKAQLDGIGFVSTGKNPQNLQLFFRGIELTVKVTGQADGVFNDSDYIEFYAIKNDGKQDEEVYIPKTDRLNKYVSMYCDDTNYFLTFGVSPGKRAIDIPTIDNAITPDATFIYTNLQAYDNEWNWDATNYGSPDLLQSYFEKNEGLVSPVVIMPNKLSGIKTLVNLIDNPVDDIVKTEFGIVDRWGYTSKVVGCKFNSKDSSTVTLTNWASKIISLSLKGITSENISYEFKVKSSPLTDDGFSLMYQKFDYPRKPIYMDNDVYQLNLKPSGRSKLSLSSATQSAIGFDITDIYNQKNVSIIFDGINNLDVFVDGTDVNKSIYLAYSPKTPAAISLKSFKIFTPSNFDYLLLSDTRLISGANNYKIYRESAEGSNYKVLLFTMDELYDQFCFGERNPVAIRRFSDYMLENSSPKALFLLGRAYSFPTDYKAKKGLDFVPTFGYPASDVFLTSGFKGNPYSVPTIPTGRLVVTNNQQINDYIEKAKEFELNRGDWQKNQLKLAGPKNSAEYVSLPFVLNTLTNIATSSTYGASTTNYSVINKPSILSLSDVAVDTSFYTKINNGVGLFTYYGHGSLKEVSYNFGYVSKETSTGGKLLGGTNRYKNKGRYPFIYINGCGVANSFKGLANSEIVDAPSDIASDWVNSKDRGAIMALSQSFLSYELSDEPAMIELYKTWFGTSTTPNMINRPMAEVVQRANKNFVMDYAVTNAPNLSSGANAFYFSNLTQSILLGDPAISVLAPKGSTPLSVNLLEFKGTPKLTENQLNWKTSSEVNFKGFDIEKSTDLKKFEKIGFQEGLAKNNLESTDYAFDDKNPDKNGNYYRLKLIDLNGKFEYSKIIFLLNENTNKLKIFGNPIKDKTFQISLNEIDISTLNIFDAKGLKLNFEIINIDKDSYKISLKKDTLRGVIILNIQDKNKASFSNKLILE